MGRMFRYENTLREAWLFVETTGQAYTQALGGVGVLASDSMTELVLQLGVCL